MTFFPSRAVALNLFGFEVHWYGLLYLLGFLIAAVLLPRLQTYRKLTVHRDVWFSLLSWSVVGVIAGGRLGYVLFYEPQFFAANPSQIFAVWQGGMAFHGGLIGVIIVLWFWSRSNKIPLLVLGDIVVIPVAIGLALGRFGNFLNQELYGTVTSLPWGMSFPGAEGFRHPIQLYAVGKDLLIAAVCFWYLRLTREQKHRWGCTAAAFLILYGVGRFLLEYLREQQYPLTDIAGIVLTRGQLLTLPLLFAGLGICLWNRLKTFTGRAKN
ncbi:MAG: prolipoprotein diacylglyceryl transferase [Candidatus Peribacteraceae bacterium]|nr:prolipoprotein diacylglyceryl transferase [Candidatus Peribacteraceae bacterium]